MYGKPSYDTISYHIGHTPTYDLFYQAWIDMDFDTCVLKGLPECSYDPTDGKMFREMQLSYFCGSALECVQVGNWDAVQVSQYSILYSMS